VLVAPDDAVAYAQAINAAILQHAATGKAPESIFAEGAGMTRAGDVNPITGRQQ
jgi:hypothetical protein